MNKDILENKLREINRVVKSKSKSQEHIGVLAGLSGMALFQFYYSKYLAKGSHVDLGAEILTHCIDKINGGYNFPTFCIGIAGAGWVLDHLEQEGLMDASIDILLPQLDDFLHARMVTDFKNGYYDFLHGGVGYGFYFLNRFKSTKKKELKNKYKNILLEFISLLDSLSEKDSINKVKWPSKINHENKKIGCDCGLAHGITSILGILAKLYRYNEFKHTTDTLLKGCINYIIKHKTEVESAVSLFPRVILEDRKKTEPSRLGWCHGDLGIGIRLWYAGKVLKDNALKNEAIRILKHAANRRSPENTQVVDASICHGSFGIAQIFNRMYRETRDPVFKETTEFWIQDGLNKAIHRDGHAGYKQWKTKKFGWTNEVSLLEGVAGIGLVILDYLADYDSNWDECLMIS